MGRRDYARSQVKTQDSNEYKLVLTEQTKHIVRVHWKMPQETEWTRTSDYPVLFRGAKSEGIRPTLGIPRDTSGSCVVRVLCAIHAVYIQQGTKQNSASIDEKANILLFLRKLRQNCLKKSYLWER